MNVFLRLVKLFLFAGLMLVVQAGYAFKYDPEMQGQTFVIEAIDQKSGVLKTDEFEFSLNKSVQVVDKQGNKLSINDLKAGMVVKLWFGSKFVSRPPLHKILIIDSYN